MILVTTANIILSAVVFTAIVGLLTWAIQTSRPQHDRVSAKSSRLRRPRARADAVACRQAA